MKYRLTLFNSVKDNEPQEREITWDDFLRVLANPEISPERNVKLFCPAVFAGKRGKETAREVSMLVLDVDKGANLAEDWAFIREWGYTCALYTSHSHQRITEKIAEPEDRYRVVFPLAAPVDGSVYERLWLWANAQLGGLLDPQTKFRNAIYFKPCKYSANAPYVFQAAEGELLDWQELDLPEMTQPKPAHIPRDTTPVAVVGQYDKGALTEYERNLDFVRNAPDGNKHRQLNASSFYLGRFVGAGRLDRDDVEESLYIAVQQAGAKDLRHARYTIRRGVQQGATEPLWAKEYTPATKSEKPQEPEAIIEEIKSSNGRLYSTFPEMAARYYAGEFIVNSVPTGIIDIDEHLFKQGLPRKEVSILSGLSGGGKSTLSLEIMKCVMDQGERILLFPFEMNFGQIVGRFVGYCIGTPFWDYHEMNDRNPLWREGQEVFDYYVQAGKLIVAGDTRFTGIDVIEATTQDAIQNGDIPSLIIVDHFDHISGGNGTSDIKRAEDISKRLKYLSVESGAATLLLSQVNKSAQGQMERGNKVFGSALRGTGALYHDARLVMIIESTEEDGLRNYCLRIEKQSYGKSGIEIPLWFDNSFYQFQKHKVTVPSLMIPEF